MLECMYLMRKPANNKNRTATKKKQSAKRIRPIHVHIGLASTLVLAAGIFLAVSAGRERTAYAGPPAAPSGKVWQLHWGDDFNGSSVDTAKWNIQDNSNFGSSNHEDQCYKAANTTVSGGSLRLTAQRQTVSCGATNPDTGNSTYYFTSGMVTTRAQGGSMKFKFKQGYAEARVKSPKGNPYWPAFWLVGPNDGSTPGWPDYGEFDILEHYGARPDITTGTLHYKCNGGNGHCKTAPTWYNIKTDSAYGGTSTLGTQITNQASLDAYSGGTSDFQVYGFLWESNRLSWYVNGRKFRYFDGANLYRIEQNGTQTLEATTANMGTPAIPFSTVFGYDHSIHLNLAVGGDGPRYSYYGYTGQDSSGGYTNGNYAASNPGAMEVDYVRIYQLATAPTPPPPDEEDETPAPPPTTTPTPSTPATSPTPATPNTSTPVTITPPAPTATVTPASGESVSMVADQLSQNTIERVEYYVDGTLASTTQKPPFTFDTENLQKGRYVLTEKVYYTSGSTSEKSIELNIEHTAGKRDSAGTNKAATYAYLGIATILIGGLFVLPLTRQIMLWPIRSILARLFTRS